MVKIAMTIFAGGAFGAVLREITMLLVPNPVDKFPMDILVANLLATFLLGLVAALHRRQIVSDNTETFLGTGLAGGLSTFSSFAHGSVVLMSASRASAVVASLYVLISLALGYAAVVVGMRLGELGAKR